jgi:hypothetical protein
MWSALETPQDSGVYNQTLLTFGCAKTSPIPCDFTAKSPLPSLGYIFSFGEDNAKDLYLLTSKGVYRVVDPSSCNYECPIKSSASAGTPPPAASPSSAFRARSPTMATLLFVGVLLVLLSLGF